MKELMGMFYLLGLLSGFGLGLWIGACLESKSFEDRAVKAGVAMRILTNPCDRSSTFVFVTNSVEKIP